MSESADAGFVAYVATAYPSLVRYAFLLTGSRSTADDLVQTALVGAYARLARVDPDRFDAYVRRSVVNAHISAGRRLWNRERPVDELPEHPATSELGRVEDRDQLAAALAVLPARQRAALVLRFYEDLSEQATAAALGCRPGTVKSLVSRGLGRLRILLDAETADPTVPGWKGTSGADRG